MKNVYVTFQVKPTKFCQTMLGLKTKHYAIKCNNIKDAHEAASDVYGIDGISYLRINTCGRLRHKDTKIILYGSYYDGEIN